MGVQRSRAPRLLHVAPPPPCCAATASCSWQPPTARLSCPIDAMLSITGRPGAERSHVITVGMHARATEHQGAAKASCCPPSGFMLRHSHAFCANRLARLNRCASATRGWLTALSPAPGVAAAKGASGVPSGRNRSKLSTWWLARNALVGVSVLPSSAPAPCRPSASGAGPCRAVSSGLTPGRYRALRTLLRYGAPVAAPAEAPPCRACWLPRPGGGARPPPPRSCASRRSGSPASGAPVPCATARPAAGRVPRRAGRPASAAYVRLEGGSPAGVGSAAVPGTALPGTHARFGRPCTCACCRPLLPAALVPPALPPAAAAMASDALAACIRSRSAGPTASCGALRMPTQKKGCCRACTAVGRRRGSHWHMAVMRSMASGLAVGTSFCSGCAGICGKRKPICRRRHRGAGLHYSMARFRMQLEVGREQAMYCCTCMLWAHGSRCCSTHPLTHLLCKLQALWPGGRGGCAHHTANLVELVRLRQQGARRGNEASIPLESLAGQVVMKAAAGVILPIARHVLTVQESTACTLQLCNIEFRCQHTWQDPTHL